MGSKLYRLFFVMSVILVLSEYSMGTYALTFPHVICICFIKISDISNVGSLQPLNRSVYMASERRIDISPVTIYVSGVYACIAENVAGKEMTLFTITVKGIERLFEFLQLYVVSLD